MNLIIISFIFFIILVFCLYYKKNVREDFQNECPPETYEKCKNYADNGPITRPKDESVRDYVTPEGSCMYGISKHWWCGPGRQHWENQHGPERVNGYDCTKCPGFGINASSQTPAQPQSPPQGPQPSFQAECPQETYEKCKNYADNGPVTRPKDESVRDYVTPEGSCMYGISKHWWCGPGRQHWENQHGPERVNGYDCTKCPGFGINASSQTPPQVRSPPQIPAPVQSPPPPQIPAPVQAPPPPQIPAPVQAPPPPQIQPPLQGPPEQAVVQRPTQLATGRNPNIVLGEKGKSCTEACRTQKKSNCDSSMIKGSGMVGQQEELKKQIGYYNLTRWNGQDEQYSTVNGVGKRLSDDYNVSNGAFSTLPGLWMREDGTKAQISFKSDNEIESTCDARWGDMRRYCPCEPTDEPSKVEDPQEQGGRGGVAPQVAPQVTREVQPTQLATGRNPNIVLGEKGKSCTEACRTQKKSNCDSSMIKGSGMVGQQEELKKQIGYYNLTRWNGQDEQYSTVNGVGKRLSDDYNVSNGAFSTLPGLWMREDGTKAQISFKSDNEIKSTCDARWDDMRRYCYCESTDEPSNVEEQGGLGGVAPQVAPQVTPQVAPQVTPQVAPQVTQEVQPTQLATGRNPNIVLGEKGKSCTEACRTQKKSNCDSSMIKGSGMVGQQEELKKQIGYYNLTRWNGQDEQYSTVNGVGKRLSDDYNVSNGAFSTLPGLWMREDGTKAQISFKSDNEIESTCDARWGDMRRYCYCEPTDEPGGESNPVSTSET